MNYIQIYNYILLVITLITFLVIVTTRNSKRFCTACWMTSACGMVKLGDIVLGCVMFDLKFTFFAYVVWIYTFITGYMYACYCSCMNELEDIIDTE